MIWGSVGTDNDANPGTTVTRGDSSSFPFFHFLGVEAKGGTCPSSIAAVDNDYFNPCCAVLMSANHVPDGVENKAFSAIPPSGISTSPLCENDRRCGNELTPMQPNSNPPGTFWLGTAPSFGIEKAPGVLSDDLFGDNGPGNWACNDFISVCSSSVAINWVQVQLQFTQSK